MSTAPIGMTPYDPVHVLQEVEDRSFNVALVNWQNAGKAWIAANTHNRDLGLPFTPKPTPPPQRRIYSFDQNGHVVSKPDDTMVFLLPELPPLTPQLVSTGGTTGAGATTDAQLLMLQQILLGVTKLVAHLESTLPPEQLAELQKRTAVWGS